MKGSTSRVPVLEPVLSHRQKRALNYTPVSQPPAVQAFMLSPMTATHRASAANSSREARKLQARDAQAALESS